MKKNQKTTLVLSALLVSLSLCACEGVTVDIKDIAADTSGDIKDISVSTDIGTEDNAFSVDDTLDITSAIESTPANTEPAEELTPEITEMVCFTYDGVTVTAKEIVEDSIWGTGIKLNIDNQSENDYAISVEYLTVNNYMVDEWFSCEVAAGKKANDTLYLSSDDMEASGIDNIGQVEIYFYIYNPNSYDRIYETEAVVIQTSFFEEMDVIADNVGELLYEDSNVRIVGKYVDEQTFWGSSVVLEIENRSNKTLDISCEDMSINGYMVSGWLYESVLAGKHSICTIDIPESDLTENDITAIEDIELKFEISDPDDYTFRYLSSIVSFQVQ